MHAFGVVSELKESTMDSVNSIINVIDEDDEKQWPKDTTLRNT